MLTLWSRLSRFLEYPELELINDLAENAMRPVALGRRNWIHVLSSSCDPLEALERSTLPFSPAAH
jgi:transposase